LPRIATRSPAGTGCSVSSRAASVAARPGCLRAARPPTEGVNRNVRSRCRRWWEVPARHRSSGRSLRPRSASGSITMAAPRDSEATGKTCWRPPDRPPDGHRWPVCQARSRLSQQRDHPRRRQR
jgi:hypothetical protein